MRTHYTDPAPMSPEDDPEPPQCRAPTAPRSARAPNKQEPTMTDNTMREALQTMFKAGFIEAAQWGSPSSQDVDSPALNAAMAERVEPTITALGWQSQQAQGEPVAAQQRFRHPQKTMPNWSPWQPAEINTKRPSWKIDSVGYEVEYRLLYEHPPAHAAVPDEYWDCDNVFYAISKATRVVDGGVSILVAAFRDAMRAKIAAPKPSEPAPAAVPDDSEPPRKHAYCDPDDCGVGELNYVEGDRCVSCPHLGPCNDQGCPEHYAKSEPEPTYYAVIDVDGDVQAVFYTSSYPSARAAQKRAREYITEARANYPHAYDWVVEVLVVQGNINPKGGHPVCRCPHQ